MHERDLRRQALESGKTVSRKQKAKHLSARSSQAGSTGNSPAVSPSHSPAGSRSGSRAPSRAVSEDEEESDELAVASLDLTAFAQFDEALPEVWKRELHEVMDQVVERTRNKRNTAEAREETLAIYSNILRAQYASDEITLRLDELIPSFVKCFKSGSTERESIYALKALAITFLTTGEPLFDEVNQPLRARIQDGSSNAVQEAAIHTLGTAAFFGGAGQEDVEDVMDFFLDIAESDGEVIEAHDCGEVVAAALQEWGLLATQFQELEDRTERPLECFENQLDSSDLGVLQAAGENIALLYEQSFSRVEEDENGSGDDGTDDEFEFGNFKRKYWAKRYDVFPGNEFALKTKLADLSKSSARYLGKGKRKDLHKTFTDVLQTVEHPYRGPRFSTALNEEMTSYMGHRHVIRFGKDGTLTINRWWKLHRFEAMKRIIGGGFVTHYHANEVVYGSLPSSLEAPVDF
ncbi:hypothetical protein EJ08DRAFT_593172 [Tothia fuscella]|uniref:Interferon-related developmental regulator N-terminal domain-containing protein n=1 Tax=Tothia fuscella TaxID=1048955 RepID=A0A9P4TWK5_9PEZI|nr:hypothetical protein EJ08DRAFT_593172 [Tothia fuscella]